MALTITSVTPNSGLTGGREFALIDGTDFNIAVNSDGSAKMQVFFGAKEATRVRVRSATELDCLTPIQDLGTYDVKVVDTVTIDEDTLTAGYSFHRPELGGGAKSEPFFVTEYLIQEFQRQILEEVMIGVDVDYDDDPIEGISFIKIAKTPAIVLFGPSIVTSGGALQRSAEPWVYDGSGLYQQSRKQEVCNLQFTLHGVDTNFGRTMNLLKEVISFFNRNAVLTVPRDPSAPTVNLVDIDMRPEHPQDWTWATRANDKNLKHFVGRFTLFGVPIGHDDVYDEAFGGPDGSGYEIDFVLAPTEPL